MKSFQHFFELISVYPSSETVKPIVKLRNHLFGILLFCIALTSFGASVADFVEFAQIDLENALYASSQISAFGCAAYTIAVGYQQRHSIAGIIMEFRTIRNEHLSKFIEVANQRGEFLTVILMKYIMFGWCFNCFALAGSSYIYCLIEFGHVDFDHLFCPLKFILPWNQRTLFGWMGETAFSIISGCTYWFIIGVFAAFFITICEYLRAFYEHYRTVIGKLDEKPTKDVKRLLKESIQLHIRMKQLFQRTTDVHSAFILIQLICSMITLSGTIFQLDLAITHLDMAASLLMIICVLDVLNLFVYCYFGHIATDSFLRMADCIFEAKWYNQPLQLQKYFRIMIQNAQQPIRFHGFGVAYLDLNAYCKILKTVFSYYMMFKTLTSKP